MIEILVVEDTELYRQAITRIIHGRADLRILAEVTDGLEAVRLAEELQPDLILLDIRLPNLNGIEAARKIRSITPQSNIIFVTQELSPEFISEAFSLGGKGYVAKIDLGRDLLIGIDAVFQGKTFISSSLEQNGFKPKAKT